MCRFDVDLKIIVETWRETEATIGRAAFGEQTVFVDDFRRSNSNKNINGCIRWSPPFGRRNSWLQNGTVMKHQSWTNLAAGDFSPGCHSSENLIPPLQAWHTQSSAWITLTVTEIIHDFRWFGCGRYICKSCHLGTLWYLWSSSWCPFLTVMQPCRLIIQFDHYIHVVQ